MLVMVLAVTAHQSSTDAVMIVSNIWTIVHVQDAAAHAHVGLDTRGLADERGV